MDKPLEGMKIAILATDMFEESELAEPQKALHEAGAETDIIAPTGPQIIAANHFDKGPAYAVNCLLDEVDPADYDGVLLPGGALSADQLRAEDSAQEFVRHMDLAGKPIAFICHAPWLLISAGLVADRTLTSYPTIADDIKNASGNWIDSAAVRDGNWVSSRQPDDLPAFNETMIALFSEYASATIPRSQRQEMVFREGLSLMDRDNDN